MGAVIDFKRTVVDTMRFHKMFKAEPTKDAIVSMVLPVESEEVDCDLQQEQPESDMYYVRHQG